MLAAIGLAGCILASPAAAQRGCSGKPGSPDQAAVFQYCPHQGRQSHPPHPTNPSHGGGKGHSEIASTGGNGGKASTPGGKISGGSGGPRIPVADYPSTGGIDVLLAIIVALALGLGVVSATRLWRRHRPQAS